MRSHEWRDRTDDGELRLMRAEHHGGRWRLLCRLKSEPRFVELDPPTLDDLEALLEVAEGKYRRGRLPHEQLLQVRALVEEAQERQGP